MGTGFLRNTLSNREGGADLEEYRVNQVLDRTMTLGTTWLGLTTGCAQCHDHKFDAISQREFYQLYAFFNNADELNLYAPLPGEREPWEAGKQEFGWGQTTPRELTELLIAIRRGLAVRPAASRRMHDLLVRRSYWDGEALSQPPPTVAAMSKQGAVNRSRSEVFV